MRKLSIIALCLLAIYGLARAADVTNSFSPPAIACTNQFVRSIAALTGVGTCASIAAGDFPALTGDITTPGGSLATTLVASARLKSKFIATTFDLTSATGATTAITGFGFTPTSCQLLAAVGGGSAASIGLVDSGRLSGSIFDDNDGIGTAVWNTSSTFAIGYTNNAGTTAQTATVQSFDVDGLTLVWTKTGSPTGTLQIKALCYR